MPIKPDPDSAADPEATADLMALVYDRLRLLAAAYLRRERAAHTLQPTALVHEAYLRLVDISQVEWQGKSHFFAVAARQMRRVLVDHARKAGARKRGSRPLKVSLHEDAAVVGTNVLDVVALDEALEKLTRQHTRRGRVAEMRIFAGMQVEEVAQALGVSPRTVKDDWRVARAWIARELGGQVE